MNPAIAQKKENTVISIAKALCIILVVVGHSGCPRFVHTFLHIFHVPLFFFTSGYFFRNAETMSELGNKLIKRIKRLYIPFWLYCTAFLLLNNLFIKIGFLGSDMPVYGIKDYADKILWLTLKMDATSQLLGGFWFIRSLFIAAVINEFALFIGRRIKGVDYYLLAVSFICVLFLRSYPPGTPIVRQLVLAAYGTVFFLYGKIFHKFEDKLKYDWSILTVSFFFLIAWSFLYPRPLSINVTRVFDSFMFMAVAPIGILFVMNLAFYLDRFILIRKTFIYIGNHTLAVLALHFVCFKLITMFAIAIGAALPGSLADFPVAQELKGFWWLLYSMAGVSLPVAIVWLLNKNRNE